MVRYNNKHKQTTEANDSQVEMSADSVDLMSPSRKRAARKKTSGVAKPKPAIAKKAASKKATAKTPKAASKNRSAAASKKKSGAKAKTGSKQEGKKKRPKSAYIFYSNSVHNQVTAENPDKTFGERSKIIGAMWRALSAEKKEPFEKMAAKDKARAQKENESQ